MRLAPGCVFLLSLVGLIAAAPTTLPPVGVYRSAAQYHRQQPAPAGTDVRRSEKRSTLVVTQQRGPSRVKKSVPLDSVWGYVNGRGRSFRIHRGTDYQIEQADTLTVYTMQSNQQALLAMTPIKSYYFSRGLNGLIFPLTEKNLRLAYEAGSPAFVEAMKEMVATDNLNDYDEQTGSYRVVTLYKASLQK